VSRKDPPKDLDMTPAMVAEATGMSRHSALRHMLRIAKSYPGIVTQTGRVITGKASQLVAHIPQLKGKTATEKLLRMLETRLIELENRLDGETSARIEFQRRVVSGLKSRKIDI
jgi:hypothetical protein